jgi:predicted acetyltransferase
MMRGVIRELHERGRALCALFPSTYGLYRKAGFEPAGTRMIYKLNLSTLDLRERGLPVRPLTDADLPAIEQVHRARAQIANGNVDRSPHDWRRILKFGTDRIYAYVVEGPAGEIEGFIVFNQEGKPRAAYEIVLRDLAATTPRAARRLLTFLGQHRTMCEHAYYFAGPVDTILMQAPEEWNEIDHRMQWMLRIVNVEEALRQRGYPPGLTAEVELEVEDDLIPANAGRFVLRVGNGVAEVERGGAGRVKVSIRGLAPLFTSQLSALQLAQMGQARGDERDLAGASAVFAGPAPWMNDRF